MLTWVDLLHYLRQLFASQGNHFQGWLSRNFHDKQSVRCLIFPTSNVHGLWIMSLLSLQFPCLSLCFSILMKSVSTSDLCLKIFLVIQRPCLPLCSWTNSMSTTKPKRFSSQFSAAFWKRLFHKSWQLQRQSLRYEFWLFFSKRAFRLGWIHRGCGKAHVGIYPFGHPFYIDIW